jgi:hypothetical protein
MTEGAAAAEAAASRELDLADQLLDARRSPASTRTAGDPEDVV